MDPSRIAIDVVQDEAAGLASMGAEVREGLLRTPKEIPSKYFYDERGSDLFEQITRLPEYYLSRAEERLLERFAGDLARGKAAEELVELGPGYGRKTRRLLEAMGARDRPICYVPFDVSAAAIETSVARLLEDFPSLGVRGVVGDFQRHLHRIPPGRERVIAFLGSTIGNFLRPEAVLFLSQIAGLLQGDGCFLLGTDLVKDKGVLHAAYNDSRGITAEFNRNILRVVNHRLDGDFDPEAFDHVAFYDEVHERVEMHLRSRRKHRARLHALGLEVGLEGGEMVRTEVSCKYTRGSVEEMLGAAGLALERWLTEEDGAFALSLSRPR